MSATDRKAALDAAEHSINCIAAWCKTKCDDAGILSLIEGHIKSIRASLVTPPAPMPSASADDAAEHAYWRFDARRKGYGEWKANPQSERGAFKAEYHAAQASTAMGAENERLRETAKKMAFALDACKRRWRGLLPDMTEEFLGKIVYAALEDFKALTQPGEKS